METLILNPSSFGNANTGGVMETLILNPSSFGNANTGGVMDNRPTSTRPCAARYSYFF